MNVRIIKWFGLLIMVLALTLVPGQVFSAGTDLVKGFTITEIGNHLYDASLDATFKTEAQVIVDQLFDLGVRHINLSPRAYLRDPRGSRLHPVTPYYSAEDEKARYLRLVGYIQGKGMTVGIRPIVLVVDAYGQTPYVEYLPNGEKKIWWHGNIQPMDPSAWFLSFFEYIRPYLEVASQAKVAEFTLGAELESMTVGIGSEWSEHPKGFPSEWLRILHYAKRVLAPETRIMYDVNFTDSVVLIEGKAVLGGELAKWRKQLAYPETSPNSLEVSSQIDLKAFWTGLSSIGVDMYRSLASGEAQIPEEYEQLLALLKQGAEGLIQEIEETLYDINKATGSQTRLIFKEVGFKSVERGFINPFLYAGTGDLNLEHQAAAYEAVLSSFFESSLIWFGGMVFWDASVDLNLHGPFDYGFSPIGKERTTEVLKQYFSR